jgi:hypothetical protein
MRSKVCVSKNGKTLVQVMLLTRRSELLGENAVRSWAPEKLIILPVKHEFIQIN